MTKYYAAAATLFFITPAAFAAQYPAIANAVDACCAALNACCEHAMNCCDD